MQKQQMISYLSGGNSRYLEELYEAYLTDPNSVSSEWRSYFDSIQDKGSRKDTLHSHLEQEFLQIAKQPVRVYSGSSNPELQAKQEKVYHLIAAYRRLGHLNANTDPLHLAKLPYVEELHLEHYGFTEADLNTCFSCGDFLALKEGSLREIFQVLRETYCHHIGIEYMHITKHKEVAWFQERFEAARGRISLPAERKKRVLEKLIAAEGLERFLGAKYVGQKRFSLEGGEALIPLLDTLIQRSTTTGVKEIVIGLAHRGRLNVLINILGKAPEVLFKEFEGKNVDAQYSWDVKYHMGFSSVVDTPNGPVRLVLGFNPSHLEIIDPVVEGSVRARQERRQDQKREEIIPVLVHGDAAFIGQGVVAETLNLSQTRGYATGGTVHIVVNNQVGFTTNKAVDARSTVYSTDITKMIEAPVMHVNGDDPEAVIFAIQLAFEYRQAFKKDVVIDMVCYRRHGHNEADEPSATQPLMYKIVKAKPSVVKTYAEQLTQEGVIAQVDLEKLEEGYRSALEEGKPVINIYSKEAQAALSSHTADWSMYFDKCWTASYETKVAMKVLKAFGERLVQLPSALTLQPQVARMMGDREKMIAGEMLVNWGFAETLAYATLVTEGYPVRLSGQDSGRGTFAHRHAVLHDQSTGEEYIPLNHLSNNQAKFMVIDSVLSEMAVLGFEYGYASASPNTLVIWEAQFGDFANGAQVVIDQFISSAEQKWGRLCGLVMFLPHGYEGQGPEHSSARLERYLQLCAQNNIQVCVPTTPAQCYHMIRRQILRPYRKPLIVMTPKSLLRHKLAVSSLDELANGQFQLVIPETEKMNAKDIKRVILCSGKVYYDILEKRAADKRTDVAILRIEQLYPFPEEELKAELAKYKNAKEIVWCQEEPKNQGAWYCTQHRFRACLQKGQELLYAGRPDSASPAVGLSSVHQSQQAAFIKEALG